MSKQKIGIFIKVIPGARILSMVAITFIAPSIDDALTDGARI